MDLLIAIIITAFAALFTTDLILCLEAAWKASDPKVKKQESVTVLSKHESTVSIPEVIEDPWEVIYNVVNEISESIVHAKEEDLKVLPLLTAAKQDLIPQPRTSKLTKTQINKLNREELMHELGKFDLQPLGSLKDLRNTLKLKLML